MIDNGSNYISNTKNVNYGVCKAKSGTVAPITANCSKVPNENANYCDRTTPNQNSGKSSATVLSTAEETSAAITTLGDGYVGLNTEDGRIIQKWALDAGMILDAITSFIGVQFTAAQDGKRSLRFVCGMEDDLTVDEVGLQVQAFYGTSSHLLFEDIQI